MKKGMRPGWGGQNSLRSRRHLSWGLRMSSQSVTQTQTESIKARNGAYHPHWTVLGTADKIRNIQNMLCSLRKFKIRSRRSINSWNTFHETVQNAVKAGEGLRTEGEVWAALQPPVMLTLRPSSSGWYSGADAAGTGHRPCLSAFQRETWNVSDLN